MAGVLREWEAVWLDPREDIYTLADGEPVNVVDNESKAFQVLN